MEKIDRAAMGRRSRRLGAQFELDVRRDMTSKGWVVAKWQNNIDLQTNEIIQSHSNRFNSRSCGFPDFIMFRQNKNAYCYELKFVECKTNNKLSKEEKIKLEVLRKLGHSCYVAFKDGKEIKYREFMEYKERDSVCRK